MNRDCLMAMMVHMDISELLTAAEVCRDWQEAAQRVFTLKYRELKLDYICDTDDLKKAASLLRVFGCVASYIRVSLVHYDDWMYDYGDPIPLTAASRKLNYFIINYCKPGCVVVKLNFVEE